MKRIVLLVAALAVAPAARAWKAPSGWYEFSKPRNCRSIRVGRHKRKYCDRLYLVLGTDHSVTNRVVTAEQQAEADVKKK